MILSKSSASISKIKQKNQYVEFKLHNYIYHIFYVIEELDAEEITDNRTAGSAKSLCFDTKT
jgi:hypothetical protein